MNERREVHGSAASRAVARRLALYGGWLRSAQEVASRIPWWVGALLGLVGILAVGFGVTYWIVNQGFPGDTLTYYLAGLRLNSGHQLYDLAPDDFWHYDHPEFPLYGPPLIGVIWRPIAALPGGWGFVPWLTLTSFSAVYAIFYVVLATRGFAGALVLLLAPSLTLLIGVGNVDALVITGLIGVWKLATEDRQRAAGLLAGTLIAVKLTPAVVIVWLFATRRWSALAWTAIALGVLGVVTMVGSEPGIWFRYLRVMIEGASGGRTGALVILAAGLAGVLALRNRPSIAWALAILMIPFGSPVAAGHSWAVLLAALAPAAAGSRGRYASRPEATGRSLTARSVFPP